MSVDDNHPWSEAWCAFELSATRTEGETRWMLVRPYPIDRLAHVFGVHMAPHFCSAPLTWDMVRQRFVATGAVLNIPAAVIILLVMFVLMRGSRASARINNFLVVLKLVLLAVFVVTCFGDIDTANFFPLISPNTGIFGQFGVSGVLRAASLLVFAYLGVDNLSTTALEAKNPQHTLPRAIAFTVAICTSLYVLVSVVLCGVVNYSRLDVADPIAIAAATTGRGWLETLVEVAAVSGLTSVLLVQIYAMPRIFFSMAHDGLLPKAAAHLHPRSGVPDVATYTVGVLCAILAGLLPIDVLGELCSSGTLFAFVLVSVGVCIMRVRHPDLPRKFRVPFGPYVIPGASVLVCLSLLGLSGLHTLLRLLAWLLVGLACYVSYGIKHSKLRTGSEAA